MRVCDEYSYCFLFSIYSLVYTQPCIQKMRAYKNTIFITERESKKGNCSWFTFQFLFGMIAFIGFESNLQLFLKHTIRELRTFSRSPTEIAVGMVASIEDPIISSNCTWYLNRTFVEDIAFTHKLEDF